VKEQSGLERGMLTGGTELIEERNVYWRKKQPIVGNVA